MDITTYADRLRSEVSAATALGGPELVANAERLLLALDPAVRLVLLEALTDAAAEISSTMSDGSVETRLRGRELEFVLEGMATADDTPAEPASMGTEPDEDADSADLARITLRLPENLKVRAEELAAQRGQSLNAWLVDAVRSSTRLTPPLPPTPPAFDFTSRLGSSRRMTGWA